MSAIRIPSWLVQEASGAAAFFIPHVESLPSLSVSTTPASFAIEFTVPATRSVEDVERRERLRRFVSDNARPFWRETGPCSIEHTWTLSPDDLYTAQFILAATAYRAPEIQPIGHLAAGLVKDQLRYDASIAADLASRIRHKVKEDWLIENAWQIYRKAHDSLPDSLSDVAGIIDGLADFQNRYAEKSRPAGPRIAVVQQPSSERAHTRSVVIQIGKVCRDYFREPMHAVVAGLAGLALDRPVSKRYAREVLRSAGVG
jgi:hypothetical protein